MAPSERIVIRGAREHNLKDIDLELPRNSLIVMTGLSGSGKSSLAFDTIYAEGQRRYVESLSAYARQFLGLMEKPDVDSIDGLSPAISIDQKTTSRNPRSTVGTVTEVYDYLRLLWARIGKPHCPECGEPIEGQSVEQITDRIMTLEEGTRFMVMAPVVRGRKGEFEKLLEQFRLEGYTRVRVDNEIRRLDEEIKLDKKFNHDISVVVDRLVMKGDLRRRLSESVEAAAALAGGVVEVDVLAEGSTGDATERAEGENIGGVKGAKGAGQLPEGVVDRLTFSERFACLNCGTSIPELEPRIFSFNSPHGACERCHGLGFQRVVDPELVVPDPTLSLSEGALQPWRVGHSRYWKRLVEAVAEDYGIDPTLLGRTSPMRTARSSSTAPGGSDTRSTTRTASAGGGPTASASRASSTTSSAATRRRTPTACASVWRATWPSSPARTARARASGPRASPSRSAGSRSTSTPSSRRARR